MPEPSPPPKSPAPRKGASATAQDAGGLVSIWVVLGRLALWGGIALGGVLASIAFLVAVALAVAYPNLPDISDISDYRPKLPLRVFSAEGVLLGEFGEERRSLTPIAEIPQVMKDAVLAIEDSRFYQHGGVDYVGVMRAAIANLGRTKSQGASTITMQVARNVYLSSEKTYLRKIYEILLTFKLEHALTKDQILEIYMNQIYLGQRAYGFAAASETYFGKPLKEISIAQAAMLAGLPKAPSAYNPVNNPRRARARQLYIIERMEENGFITARESEAAKKEPLKLRHLDNSQRTHAEYIAETVRQLVFAQYGDETYTRGLNVHTTIKAEQQEAAYQALRRGIMDYERRQVYRGPEKFINLPEGAREQEEAIEEVLAEHPDNGDVLSAVVLRAEPRKLVAMRSNGETVEITGDGLFPAQSGLAANAPAKIKLRPGAVIRIIRNAKTGWDITQLPEVEGAFVSLDPRDGSILAMVGGFDFAKNKFNHVTQAWRQPGSSFKPFIYSAALEKGFTATTLVNDAPLFFSAAVTGGQPWEPKNYDGKFEGAMPLVTALAKSKNMVSIQVLQSVGPKNAQEWIGRFGFEADRHPPYLTMALGAGSVTPMQMATGYAVFANGGYRVDPWVIARITDQQGRLLARAPQTLPQPEPERAIEPRNAFIMSRLLQEITRSGTAARAQATLQRPDLYGKTGTTNDAVDTWFAGYHPTNVAVVWMGYDNPRSLGDRETGGGLSLPVWISFMQTALKGVPVSSYPPPEGVVQQGGEWYYQEFARDTGVRSLSADTPSAEGSARLPATSPEERKSILDLFRN